MRFISLISIIFLWHINYIWAQKADKIQLNIYDGIFIIGYVDQGGFVNYTGPNINFKRGKSKFILGMLPSLRIKEDKSTGTKNSLFFPSLGTGFTYSYKIWAFQLPLYYNSKTVIQNGRWHLGFGVGLRLNEFNK